MNKPQIALAVAGPVMLAIALLAPGLGRFGVWEPHEAVRSNTAASYLNDTAFPNGVPPGPHVQERLVAKVWRVLGPSVITTRLPSVVIGLTVVLALVTLLLPLGDTRLAAMCGIALGTAPVFIFHGRQLTSAMPQFLGETLAIGGLFLFTRAPKKRTAVIAAIVGLLGLTLGGMSAGMLLGVVAPTLTVCLTLFCIGGNGAPAESPKRQLTAAVVTLIMAVVAAAGFAAAILFAEGDIQWITGGLPTKPTPQSFEFPLEQLAYGWFPWSAIVPLSMLALVSGDRNDPHRPLRLLVVCGVIVACLVGTVATRLCGVRPLLFALPMAVGAVLGILDLIESDKPLRFGALVAVVLFAIMLRDFGQTPKKLLLGYAFIDLPLAETFKPWLATTAFALPAGLVFFALGLKKFDRMCPPNWRRTFPIAALTVPAAIFGFYIAHSLIPGLSVDLSSKHAFEAFERYKRGDEKLGIYKAGAAMSAQAEPLRSVADIVDWLERKERVFALFPPADLAEIDRQMRLKTGRHVFVLDAKSKRFMLATSKPRDEEVDQNPIAPFVASRPFQPPLAHPVDINFDDKMTLLGWALIPDSKKAHLSPGGGFSIETHWRCEGRLNRNYKMFLHIDGPGGRIHADHRLLQDVYPTSKWVKGDYLRDIYSRKVPFYQKSGIYTVKLGVYLGTKRLAVKSGAPHTENAIKIATIEVK